jgi:hypothetical protein
VKSWFGNLHLKAGESKTSEPITILSTGEVDDHWVFKISATDASGHHISAWAVR